MSLATRALFRCDGAPVPRELSRASWTQDVPLRSAGDDRNMRLGGFNETASVASALTGRAHDLVRIAAYAYMADQAISRGGTLDVHHAAWRRVMALCVPVGDSDFWNQDRVKSALERVLMFATQDAWTFTFSNRRKDDPDQLDLFDAAGVEVRPARPPDHVLLLSGGADSLCAAVLSLGAGRHPHLVCHRPSPAHDARQQKVSTMVGLRFGAGVLSRTGFPIHRVGWEAKESSQRSRAFLFASLGASVAQEAGVREVVLADNGVVSIGLPLHKGLPGALMSRTTHPRFLQLVNELLDIVLPGIRTVNPLQAYTRHEALTILKDSQCPDLLRLTNSCSRARNTGGNAEHCGYCSQCVDRRFGVIRAGLEAYELPDPCVLDIFTQRLDGFEQRTIPLSFIARAKRIEALAKDGGDGLFVEFPELYESLPQDPLSVKSATADLVSLLRRHAEDVRIAMRVMSERHWDAIYSDPSDEADGVAQDSLLRLVMGSGSESLPRRPVPANGRATAETVADSLSTSENRFCRQGDGWLVAFDGETAHIRDLDGMFYIAHLLANPGQDIPATRLYWLIGSSGSAGTNGVTPDEIDEAGLRMPMPAPKDPRIDEITRQQVGERLRQISAERARANEAGDQAAAIALDEEVEKWEAYLTGARGRPGEIRDFDDEEERVRDTVRVSIGRAITRIGRRHPNLARHLKDAIRRGFRCSYTPRSSVRWNVSP